MAPLELEASAPLPCFSWISRLEFLVHVFGRLNRTPKLSSTSLDEELSTSHGRLNKGQPVEPSSDRSPPPGKNKN